MRFLKRSKPILTIALAIAGASNALAGTPPSIATGSQTAAAASPNKRITDMMVEKATNAIKGADIDINVDLLSSSMGVLGYEYEIAPTFDSSL